MKKFSKIVGRILIGVLILALVAGAGGFYYFKSYLPNTVAQQSFPQIDGEINVSGLDGKVDVYRDKMGIPHIYAATTHDLFFTQGYVHAQDRFWQMDFWRHTGSGELSKMFGKGQVETDSFLRTLGWRQTAEAELEQLSPESTAILEAYAAGVNAYLKDHKGTALSLEYAVLKLLSPDYQIEEWLPVHSLTWGKAMAWDLRGNLGEEIERAVLLKTLTPAQVGQLFPAYPDDRPVIVNTIGILGQTPNVASDLQLLDYANVPLDNLTYNTSLLNDSLGPWSDGIGSNSWAVSGKLTNTGMPLLANDPHLGIQMPSIWYQVAMHCMPVNSDCSYEVAGFSFAGVPGVVIGHNAKIAWGVTNVSPDVMDLYIEKVNPENPNQYEVNGKWVDFAIREEKIQVVGGEAVNLTVRSTRHGPVISDTYGPLKDQGDPKDKEFKAFKDRAGVDLPPQYVIALAWTALTPSTPFEAIWGFDRAQNWEEFRQAASEFHVPAQNLLYADVDGNIGYQMPGNIPIRAKGDGSVPVPGWTDEYAWTGFIPFEELPYTFNPAEGYIVTANNRVAPRDYPYFITNDWSDFGSRSGRIVDLITKAPGKIDIAYIQKMHGDAYDENAATFAPLLLDLKPASELTPALDTLKGWDFQARADSTSAAVFNAFWRNFLKNTFNDDVPERYYPEGGSRWNLVMRNMMKNPNDPFWDDKTTTDITETMNDIIKKSFADGVAELQGLYGKDMSKWKWGDMHAATFRNSTLGKSGVFLIEDLFNRGPFPVGGGKAIVNATGWSVIDGYETNWLPSMRQIVDMSALNNSLTVHTTGQSGHAYNKHYDDMSKLWTDIKYYPMWWEQASIVNDSEGHLVLKSK